MNKNIIKILLPTIAAGIGLATTGCVATRCYETRPTAMLETVYVDHPACHYVNPPPPKRRVEPLRKLAPRPKVKPQAAVQLRKQAKERPHQKPAPRQRGKG